MVARRSLSLARMAAFMSSVIWSFKLMETPFEFDRGKRQNPLRHNRSGLRRIQALQRRDWQWPSPGKA
jgi:hypothetical protein